MKKLHQKYFAMFLLLVVHTLVYAQEKQSDSRGELLYSTHCNTCHTSQVHWREQKLVTDWNSLVNQVRRWQSISGLSWREEEISAVAHYLDAVYYQF